MHWTFWTLNILKCLYCIADSFDKMPAGLQVSAFKDDKSYPYKSRGNGRNFGFLPIYLTEFHSLWLFENAPGETVDLSYPPSERSHRRYDTQHPTGIKKVRRKSGAVMDIRYYRSIEILGRITARYRKSWDFDFFNRDVLLVSYNVNLVWPPKFTAQYRVI